MKGSETRVGGRFGAWVLLLVVCALAGMGLITRTEAAAPLAIKFACVAPEGSLWVNLTKEWDRELRSRTQNRIRFQIYSGGILGEEIDAIRKIRAGQIHATGVTGVGMGEMVPATRALELPRIFQNVTELDAAEKALEAYYVDAFARRGYTLLGFTEVGAIHIFTRKPIRRIEDLNAQRMWVWEGDPVSEEISKVIKVSAVPLSLLNVMPSLQTGVIDGVYGSPLAAMTMQWHNYLKYMVTEPLAYAVGVIVIDKRVFDTYPADIQSVLIETGRKYTRQMVERARVDNARAVELMKARGVQTLALDAGELKRFEERIQQIWTNLQGRLYTPELLAQVKNAALTARVNAQGARR